MAARGRTRWKGTAKQRAQLKRAQQISARKRRGKGKFGKKTKLAIGVTAIGVGGLAAYHTRNTVRENALRKKHGSKYIPRTLTGYHHTSRMGQRNIVRNQKFKVKGRFHKEQKMDEVWFTTGHKERGNMFLYGDYVVKTKVKRKHIEQHHPGWAKTGTQNKNRHNAWFSVKQKHIKKGTIRKHYTPDKNPIMGTKAQRSRAAKVRRAKKRRK